MKMVFFRHGKEFELFNKNRDDIAERILFTVFILLFTLVIYSQVSLIRPESASLAVAHDSFEGTPLGIEEYLYSSGCIELRLMSGEQDPELVVLVNGEKAAVFEGKDVKLEVVAGDIVEIDGSNTFESEVALCAVSENLERNNIGEIFATKGNIKRVIQVKIKGE